MGICTAVIATHAGIKAIANSEAEVPNNVSIFMVTALIQ